MKNKSTILSLALSLVPSLAVAQIPGRPGVVGGTLSQVVVGLAEVALDVIWVVAVAFTIIMFVLAGFDFLTAQGDPEKVSRARKSVVWGLVGVAVIVLAWSVLAFVRRQFGI